MMAESNAVAILRDLPTTQSEIDRFGDIVIGQIRNGEANPLQMHIQLKAFAKASERIIKETSDNTLREANNYPGKAFEVYGAQVSKAPVSTKYVYSDCNDPELNYLQIQFDKAKEALEKRQDFLKALTGPLVIITEDGEKAHIYPPVKIQHDGIKISFR